MALITLISASLTLNVFGQTGCLPAPPGLVGWWPGNGNALDETGCDNGTLTGPVAYAPGEVGQGFLFGGIGAAIKVGYATNLQLQNFTIESWIRRSSTSIVSQDPQGDGELFSYGSGGYGFYLIGGSWQLSLSAIGISYVSSSAAVTDTNLHHVAVTKSGGNVVFFLDGVAYPYGGSYDPTFTFSTPAAVGALGDTAGQSFFGLIDDMTIYHRALSTNEVQAIFAAGSAGKCPLQLFHAAQATATLDNGFVVGAYLTDPGYGYTNSPSVKIIGGGGSGADAVAVVSNDVVVAIHVLDAGSNYTTTPLVVIDPPFIPNPVLGIAPLSFLTFSNLTVGGVYQLQQLSGWYWTNQPVNFTAKNAVYSEMVSGVVGSGAYRLALNPVPAQAFAVPVVTNMFVVGATVTSGGSGYVTNPPVSIVGGGGSGAEGFAEVSGGVVTGIIMTNAGFGYTNTPMVEIGQPPAAAVSPTVQLVMRVDSASLAPYDNYQIQFTPALGTPWGNWNGGLFTPTDMTNSQYLFVTNTAGFLRLQYVP
jgi:hypothetical protein